MGIKGVQLTLADLSAMGVKRISVGGTLARVALGAFLRAAHEMKEQGTFGFIEDAADGQMLNSIFASMSKT
jgi:2-methylisocitrate lyase-like PEP mutase family enzyme